MQLTHRGRKEGIIGEQMCGPNLKADCFITLLHRNGETRIATKSGPVRGPTLASRFGELSYHNRHTKTIRWSRYQDTMMHRSTKNLCVLQFADPAGRDVLDDTRSVLVLGLSVWFWTLLNARDTGYAGSKEETG